MNGRQDIAKIPGPVPVKTDDTTVSPTVPSFSALYSEWYLPVRSFIARYGFEQELDDMTQEVLLKVWKSLHLFREQSTLKTWVFQIALNTLRDRFRHKNLAWYKRLLPLTAVYEPACEEENDPELYDILQKGLQKLSIGHREVLILNYLNEFNISEISGILGLSEGTVKSRLFHARKNLENAVNQLGGWK